MRAVLLAAVLLALATPAMAQKYDFTVRPERTPTQSIVVPHQNVDGPQVKLKPRYLEENAEWFLPPGASPNEKVFGGSVVYRPRRNDTELEVTFLRQFGSESSLSTHDRLFPIQKEKKAIFSIKKKF
jgi:hypothetical protein